MKQTVQRVVKTALGAVLVWGSTCFLQAQTLVPANAVWRYWKGTRAPSDPADAWLQRDFDDGDWLVGAAPFHYGEPVQGGTELNDMRYHYTTVFLRRKFTVSSIPEGGVLRLRYFVDDGLAVWINGKELFRYNLREGPLDYRATTPQAVQEPVQWKTESFSEAGQYLQEGVNQICVLLVNRSLTSSDIQFDLELSLVVPDTEPPHIVSVDPAPGPVGELRQITIEFSEPVQGIDPEDLLINGEPAQQLSVDGTRYTFSFPQPSWGEVEVRWAEGHGITDMALEPNPFVPESPYDEWTYTLVDQIPPQVVRIHPAPGTTVHRLDWVWVWFSEPVQGVDASDLLVNGRPCTSVEGILNGPYTFRFDPPQAGTVHFSWAEGHGIQDRASIPNAFEGEGWSVVFDPEGTVPDVRITEILASNSKGLQDEDGDPVDWIELWNAGDRPVNLLGWSLSDDPTEPGKWVFPEVVLQPGEYLVVFASGKDRRDPAKPLHTNFKLGADGEFLGLFNNDAPRRMVSGLDPEFPEQRTDISWGVDGQGQWHYYAQPTPGAPNSGPMLEGLTPEVTFSVPHGFFQQPFDLELRCADPNAQIRYTLDGSVPTATYGRIYEGPIHITTTTVVRACAVAPNRLPSRVRTQTYIFPEAVLHQPKHPRGFPEQWGSERIIEGDYEMDPRVVEDPRYQEEVRRGLLAIPTVSLVMPVEDWFSPDRGIYSNASKTGLAWERAVSVELIYPDGRPGFQTDAGVRIQGGTSPINWKMEKLSLKLRFRSDYGPRWLDYPVFPDSPVRRFDTLLLDAHMNNTWAYGGGVSPEAQRERATYLRDTFTSDLQLATGHVAVHGFFVHLYLNGLYWGMYELHEVPDEGFAATYFGGSKDEYDVLKHRGDLVLNGDRQAWDRLMQLVRSDVTQPSVYEQIGQMLDIPAFIDYMLVHFYVGNTDWPHHNWYAIRRRVQNGLWRFISWDSEHVMERLNVDQTGVNNRNSCAEIYDRLRRNPEFCLQFADHIHRHFGPGGVFYVDPEHPDWDPNHPERNQPAARFYRRMQEIWSAVVCESARWGDNQRPWQPYTRDKEWIAATDWLLHTFFPQRSQIVLHQLQSRGLYPDVPSPQLSLPGGMVPAGTTVELHANRGVIYYTLDGSDPRQPGIGTQSASALRYQGEPIEITRTTWLRARTYDNGKWSALTEALYQVADPTIPLYPTEIMYNPPGGDPYEFLEMIYLGQAPLDVGGFTFDGINFTFPQGTVLQPGQLVLLASSADPDAFAQRYPGVHVDGWFQRTLANGGESLRLKTPDGQVVWHVRYDDRNGWPRVADGDGASLELRDPSLGLSDPAAWKPSPVEGGTPGSWHATELVPHTLRIEEVHPTGPTGDWVELMNAGDQIIDLAGWQLWDESDRPLALPPGRLLNPGERIVVWCDGQTNAPGIHAEFALNADGDSVLLYGPDGQLVDGVSFWHVPRGYSLGRNDKGQWILCHPTRGQANQPAAVGSPTDLHLNEWLADPPPGLDDWVELVNLSDRPVPLHGLGFQVHHRMARIRWLGFVEAHGFVRLLADDRSDRGHIELHIPASGGLIRLLDAEGNELEQLMYPDQQEGVSFGRLPDGTGSFQFLGAVTPGRPNSNDPAQSDLDGDRLPDVWEAKYGLDPTSAAGDQGRNGDPDGDGYTNEQEYFAGTDPTKPDPVIALELQPQPNGMLLLRFPGSPGKDYRIQYTDSLGKGDWKDWKSVPAPQQFQAVEVSIDPTALGKAAFFRVVRP